MHHVRLPKSWPGIQMLRNGTTFQYIKIHQWPLEASLEIAAFKGQEGRQGVWSWLTLKQRWQDGLFHLGDNLQFANMHVVLLVKHQFWKGRRSSMLGCSPHWSFCLLKFLHSDFPDFSHFPLPATNFKCCFKWVSINFDALHTFSE